MYLSCLLCPDLVSRFFLAPENRGGGIFPHHMQDQLQRKQQEAMLQQQQAQQQLQQQDGQLGPNALAALMMPLGPGGTSLPQTTATPMPAPPGASHAQAQAVVFAL